MVVVLGVVGDGDGDVRMSASSRFQDFVAVAAAVKDYVNAQGGELRQPR